MIEAGESWDAMEITDWSFHLCHSFPMASRKHRAQKSENICTCLAAVTSTVLNCRYSKYTVGRVV